MENKEKMASLPLAYPPHIYKKLNVELPEGSRVYETPCGRKSVLVPLSLTLELPEITYTALLFACRVYDWTFEEAVRNLLGQGCKFSMQHLKKLPDFPEEVPSDG